MSEEKKQTKDNLAFIKNWSFIKKLKQVKHIGLIIAIIFALILLAIVFSDFKFFSGSADNLDVESYTYTSSMGYAKLMEDKLKNIIGKIKGAGNVDVMITVTGEGDEEFAEMQAQKTSLGTSATVTSLSKSGESLSSQKLGDIQPKIKGVVVVSSGAKDIGVRLNILNAIEALFGLESTQIQILIGE